MGTGIKLSELCCWNRANSALVFNTVPGCMDDHSTRRNAA